MTTSRTAPPIGDADDENIWRTACFVVKVGFRPLSTFLAAGVTVVARPTPSRPVVRLGL